MSDSVATDHDIEALTQVPSWVELTYLPSALNPSPSGWQSNYPACAVKAQEQICLQLFSLFGTGSPFSRLSEESFCETAMAALASVVAVRCLVTTVLKPVRCEM